jgi:hypothetical protein
MLRQGTKQKLECAFLALADREDDLDVERQVLEISKELLRSPAKVARCHRMVFTDFFLKVSDKERQTEPPFSSEYRRMRRVPQEHLRTRALLGLDARLTPGVCSALKKTNGRDALHRLLYAATLQEPSDAFGPHDKAAWDSAQASRHEACGKPLPRMTFDVNHVIDARSICVYTLTPQLAEGANGAEHIFTHAKCLGIEKKLVSPTPITGAMRLHNWWSVQDCFVACTESASRSNRVYFKDCFEGDADFMLAMRRTLLAVHFDDVDHDDEPKDDDKPKQTAARDADEAAFDAEFDEHERKAEGLDKDKSKLAQTAKKHKAADAPLKPSTSSSGSSAMGLVKVKPLVPRSVLNIKGGHKLTISAAALKAIKAMPRA